MAAVTSTRASSSLMPQLSSQTSNNKGRFLSSHFSDLICNSPSDMSLSENKAKKTGPNIECCMCGDVGVSSELYRCKICRFRSQHRYCSNLYPKADSYRVCNWCLIQKNDHTNTTTSTQRFTSNSPNLSSPYKHKHKDNIKHNDKPNPPPHHHSIDNNNKMMKKMKINSPPSTPVADQNNNLSPGAMQRRKPQTQSIGSPTTKKRRSSPESIPSPSPRKRIVANNNGGGGGGEKLIRRTKSEDITNRNKTSVTTKHVFRNKVVRRYKHLDEVSC